MKLAVLALLAFLTVASEAEVIPFVENDYASAVAQAKATKRPLFIEAWAPWCHTCRSMRAYVFTDSALQPYVGRFVWLAIDTENAKNAAFLMKHPVQGVPMLFVVDPAKDSVVLRYAGGATVSQLKKLLDDGERAVGRSETTKVDAILKGADRLAAAGKNSAALKIFSTS